MSSQLDSVRETLLLGKTWRYLRYLHARDSFARVADQVSSVVIAGGGRGWAEVALALEYPDISFTLTDIVDRTHGYPNYQPAMTFCWRHGIQNLRFTVWNVLEPTKNRYDMVMSTEMLEHIKDDDRAAEMMRKVATKFVYCLVPFADEVTNNDPRQQRRAWEKTEHFRPGYDEARMLELFGTPHHMFGTYWRDAGIPFRERLSEMTPEAIKAGKDALILEADKDLILQVPHVFPEAMGIRIMADVRG